MKKELEKQFTSFHIREVMPVGLLFLFGLLTMTSCSSDDDEAPGPATAEQMDATSGHWFAELSISGETDNWRTEEEGDKTTFDKVTAIFYLGDHVMQDGWWGYLYLQDDEMVNYGGINLNQTQNQFSYTMTANGLITPSSHVQNAPKVTNMRYDSTKNVITADVLYNSQSHTLTFIRPTDESWERLNEYFEILLESGIVGGYEDDGDHLGTDVTDKDATEPQRARQF